MAMLCESETWNYAAKAMGRRTASQTIVMQSVGVGGQLKLWGGGGGGSVVCPNCRHAVPLAAAPAACCPELRALLAPAPKPLPAPRLDHLEQLRRLRATLQKLALCGWYRRGLDWQAARAVLRDAAPGAFLLRDSGDTNFIFSLSVQTERGPTSVRLHYARGAFRLDCERQLVRLTPTFRCALELVQHYVANGSAGAQGTVWVDSAGCQHSPVVLRAGLRAQPPTLAHAARLAVHRALSADRIAPRLSTAPKYERLPLPRTLIAFLAEYPYSC